jgi:hypothetical protein
VHSYEPQWNPDETDKMGAIGPFTGPLDVVAYAARDILVSHSTFPSLYHLDTQGKVRCCSRDGSLSNVRKWAVDPTGLYLPRLINPRRSCPNRWLAVESRPTSRYGSCVVNEADAEAFVTVRKTVAARALIDLVDVMIFDDACHWWSLHELTTGQTTWAPPASPPSRRKRPGGSAR